MGFCIFKEGAIKFTKILLTILGGGSLILAIVFTGGCKNNKKAEMDVVQAEKVLNSENNNNNYNGIIIAGILSSTKEFSLDGPIASIYVNGGIKNNGNFLVSGNISVVGEIFDPRGLVKAGVEIFTGVEPIVIPEINVKDFLAKANYVFKSDGSIEIYENGALVETITGGKWKDPSGAQWKYDVDNNSWGIIGGKQSNLKGALYFETNFKNPAKAVTVEGQIVVEGYIKDSGKLTIKAGTAHQDALVVGGGAFFTDDINIFGKVYISGDVKITSKAKVHSGGIIIKGSLELTNEVNIYYVGLVKQKAEEIAKRDFGEVTYIYSELFSGVEEKPAVEVFIFERGIALPPSVINLWNLINLIEIGSINTANLITLIIGSSMDYSTEIASHPGLPEFISGFLDLASKLITENGYNEIDIKNLTWTWPLSFWADVEANGNIIGTYLLNSGAEAIKITPEDKEAEFQKLIEHINNVKTSDPEKWNEGQELRNQEWTVYEGMEIPFSKCKSNYSKNEIVGVPHYWVTRGCTPTAAAMVMGYHKDGGYGRLLDCGETVYGSTGIIEKLGDAMHTGHCWGTWIGGECYGIWIGPLTYPWDVESGIETFANDPDWGNGYNFDVAYLSAYTNTMSHIWNVMKDEVNNRRPGMVTSHLHPQYLYHTMTVVGWGKREWPHWYCGLDKHDLYVHTTWYTSDCPCAEWNCTWKCIAWGTTRGGEKKCLRRVPECECTSRSECQSVKLRFDWWSVVYADYDGYAIYPGHDYRYSIASISTPIGYFCPSQIIPITVRVQNTGSSTWYKYNPSENSCSSIVRLGSSEFWGWGYHIPYEHPSPLCESGWDSDCIFNSGGQCSWFDCDVGCGSSLCGINCGANRIVQIQEPIIRPGEIATFTFNITVPPYSFTDYFKLVSENTAWMCSGPLIPVGVNVDADCNCVGLFGVDWDCVCTHNPILCQFCDTYPGYCATCPSITTLAGTPLESEINTLREFRDIVLEPTDPGKFLRELYYRYGTEISHIAQQDENVKQMYRDLIAYALPEIKNYIWNSINGENHLFERELNAEEVQMIRDFLIALYPYASEDFKVWLVKGYSVLDEGASIDEIVTELSK